MTFQNSAAEKTYHSKTQIMNFFLLIFVIYLTLRTKSKDMYIANVTKKKKNKKNMNTIPVEEKKNKTK